MTFGCVCGFVLEVGVLVVAALTGLGTYLIGKIK